MRKLETDYEKEHKKLKLSFSRYAFHDVKPSNVENKVGCKMSRYWRENIAYSPGGGGPVIITILLFFWRLWHLERIQPCFFDHAVNICFLVHIIPVDWYFSTEFISSSFNKHFILYIKNTDHASSLWLTANFVEKL